MNVGLTSLLTEIFGQIFRGPGFGVPLGFRVADSCSLIVKFVAWYLIMSDKFSFNRFGGNKINGQNSRIHHEYVTKCEKYRKAAIPIVAKIRYYLVKFSPFHINCSISIMFFKRNTFPKKAVDLNFSS